MTYDKHNQIKFKTLMLKLSLCDYSDAYILVSGIITVTALATALVLGGGNKSII